MNAIELGPKFVTVASQHPILERLLLASLEFAVLALVIASAIWLCRIKWPRLTAILWVLVLAKPLVSLVIGSPFCLLRIDADNATTAAAQVAAESPALPAATNEMSAPRAPDPQELATAGPPASSNGQQLRPASLLEHGKTTASMFVANPPAALAGLWLLGVAFFAAVAAVDRYRLRRLVACAKPAGGPLCNRYLGIASTLGIRRIPRLVVSNQLESPALAGVISPVIIVPDWLGHESVPARLDWALKHELMHWRLLDPVAGLVRELARMLFYFHPAAWWVGRKWEEAAELACDRAIVASAADSQDYAEQLYQILVKIRDRRRLRLSTGLFATRTQIGRRIAALLAAPMAIPPTLNAIAVVALMIFSAVALSVGAGFADKTVAAASSTAPEQQDANAAPAGQTSDEHVAISGLVLDPAGKPFAGASLSLEYQRLAQPAAEQGPRYTAASGADGQFRFNVPKSELSKQGRDDYWNSASVTAVAEGFGFDEVSVPHGAGAKPLTLQLAKDLPIHGRILDIEGRPVAGANIRVRSVRWRRGENLDVLLRDDADPFVLQRNFVYSLGPSPLTKVATEADGRFTLAGLGAERVVRLEVSGATIEHGDVELVTRELPGRRTSTSPTVKGLYGATFEHLAAPARIITGTVHDAATGKPIAGATVHGSTRHVPATDEFGRFQLLGYPKSKQYYLQVFPPEGQPHFRANVTIDDSPGLAPLETRIELSALTIAHGHVTNQSGQPIAGSVEYYPLYPNGYVARLERVGRPASQTHIQANGEFAISVFPGPGVLAVEVDGLDDRAFQPAFVSADELRTLFKGNKDVPYDPSNLSNAVGGTGRSAIGQEQYQALMLINPDDGQESLTANIVLEPARSIRGRVLDADGQPLAGVNASGLRPGSHFLSETLKTAEFQSFGARPERPISVLFMHEGKGLGAAIDIRGDESDLTVRLQPLGSATGRVLTKDGDPAADVTLNFDRSHFWGPGIIAKTDGEGRFRVDGLAAGQKYNATILDRPGRVEIVYYAITVEPAKTKELGDAKLR